LKAVSLLFLVLISAAAIPAVAEVIKVDITGIAFSPPAVSARVGDTVEWNNKDFVAHTATARNKDWNVALPAHKKGSTIVKKPGHIDYYCTYHPTMTGEIDVRP
jgi:plastocyanin